MVKTDRYTIPDDAYDLRVAKRVKIADADLPDGGVWVYPKRLGVQDR